MRLITGEIVEVYLDGQTTMARVRIAGAFMRVPIMLLSNADVGDCILIDSGVAIARVQTQENQDVFSDSRQSHRD
jgi:hydrogenase maturation factor